MEPPSRANVGADDINLFEVSKAESLRRVGGGDLIQQVLTLSARIVAASERRVGAAVIKPPDAPRLK
jgi:hypothetical protein